MKKRCVFLIWIILLMVNLKAQEKSTGSYWQVKVDFLEPLVNRTIVARIDYGLNRHLIGLVGGYGGYISEFDNKQFDTYQDKINLRFGVEYQYFLSNKKQNNGFYLGGDCEFGLRTIQSKISDESVDNISVITPGLYFGYLWKPFKKKNLLLDLTIIHPRYTLGSIKKVDFKTVTKPYEPSNLFNFLGPWSVGIRF